MIDLPWPRLDNLPGPSGRLHQSIFTSEDPPLRWRERRLTGGIRRGPETLRLSPGRVQGLMWLQYRLRSSVAEYALVRT